MKIKPEMKEEYEEGYNKNRDPYGRGIYRFAERWANLIEKDIEECGGVTASVIANFERHGFQADTEGISGFMYGAAISILSRYWEYGDFLREWNNKQWGYEGEGVVNPAILVIGNESE